MLVNLFKYMTGPIIAAVLGIITVPILTRIFPPEVYGKANFFSMSNQLIVVFITMGSASGVVRFYHDEIVKCRVALFKKALFIPSLLIVCFLIVSISAYKSLSYFLIGEVNFYVILIFDVLLLFQILFWFASIHLRMVEKALLFSILNIFNKLFSFIIIIILYYCGYNDYMPLIIASTIVIVLSFFVGVFSERNFWLERNNKSITKVTTGEFYRYSLPFVLVQGIEWINGNISTIVLKINGTYADIGIFSAAFKFVLLLGILRTTFTMCWSPEIFKLHSENSQKAKEYLINIFNDFFFIIIFAIIGIIANVDWLVILFGNAYAQAKYIAPLLSFVPAIGVLLLIVETGISIKKKTVFHVIAGILYASLNFLLCYFFVRYYGVRGIALGMALSIIFFIYFKGFIVWRLGYKFNYKLNSIVLLFVFLYAIFNTFVDLVLWQDLLIGVIMLLVLSILYKKSVKNWFDNISILLHSFNGKS